jgi:hypothetical protein
MHMMDSPLMAALMKSERGCAPGSWNVPAPSPGESATEPYWDFRRFAVAFAVEAGGYHPSLVNRSDPMANHPDNGIIVRKRYGDNSDLPAGLELLDFEIFGPLHHKGEVTLGVLKAALSGATSLEGEREALSRSAEFVLDGVGKATIEFVRGELKSFLSGRPNGASDVGPTLINDVWAMIFDMDLSCMAVSLAFSTMRASQEPPTALRSNEFATHLAFWDGRCIDMALAVDRLAHLPPTNELQAMIQAEIDRIGSDPKESPLFAGFPRSLFEYITRQEIDDVLQRRKTADEVGLAIVTRIAAEGKAKKAPAPAAAPARPAERRNGATERDDALLDAMRADPEGSLAEWGEATGISSKGSVSRALERLKARGIVSKDGGRWIISPANRSADRSAATGTQSGTATGTERGAEAKSTEPAPPGSGAAAPERVAKVGGGRRTLTMEPQEKMI